MRDDPTYLKVSRALYTLYTSGMPVMIPLKVEGLNPNLVFQRITTSGKPFSSGLPSPASVSMVCAWSMHGLVEVHLEVCPCLYSTNLLHH